MLGDLAGVKERERISSAREARSLGGGEGRGAFRHLFDEGRWAGRIDQRASLLDRAMVKGAVGFVGHKLYAECLE